MRITKELEIKIKRSLDEKYKPEIAAKSEEFEILRAEQSPAMVEELQKLYDENPLIRALYKACNSYREFNAQSIVEGNSSAFFPKEYEADRLFGIKIRKKKDADYEALAIQIAYSKDLAAIKEAFAEMGLTF